MQGVRRERATGNLTIFRRLDTDMKMVQAQLDALEKSIDHPKKKEYLSALEEEKKGFPLCSALLCALC